MPDTGLLDDPLLTNVPVHEGYRVLRGVVLYQKLGQGGMGAVYKGRHLRLNVDVAVKVMALPLGLEPQETDNFVRRFLREAQTAASINHQNLVRVIDVNTEGGVYFLVMDYVDGESAGERLERKGKLSEEEAVEIALGAGEGLGAAHRKGIVHRDVKPDNIMIDKDGLVRVADLGLAKAYAGDTATGQPSMLTQTQTAMGTPHYMSPEQFVSTRTVGPAADVWSLGVTLYHLLTAKLPWSDSSAYAVAFMVTNDPLPDPREFCADLSDGVCRIIEKALAKDPAERYADCSEMVAAVRAHLDSIRSSPESLLPDDRAGTTKMALITITPPAPRTMTMIAQASLGKDTLAAAPARVPVAAREGTTPATIAPTRRGERSWILPAALAVGAALLVALLMVLLFVGRPGVRDPLEAEAEKFYQRQFLSFEAGEDEKVGRAIKDAGGRYDDTTFGLKIKRLGETVAARVEKEQAEQDAAERRAAFEAAMRAADEAERARDLEEAVKQLKAALARRDDPALRERLAELEKRITAVERLLAEAAKHEKAKEWDEARSRYEEALKGARGEDRKRAETRLAEVKKQIKIEETVAAIKREADTGRWREAWNRVEQARKGGISDPRVDDLSQRAAKALAPPKAIIVPLGIELVLVPEGSFKMGSSGGKATERPVHGVTLPAFYIGRREVTRSQFEASRTRRRGERGALSAEGKEPAVSMTWSEAVQFCKYLTGIDKSGATYRLPTEAEWEYAARGPEGRLYPWGNEAPSKARANIAGREDGFEGLAPVGSLPEGATPLGVLDMAGNAAEWCSGWYGLYRDDPQANPTGPRTGKARVVRGGAWVFGPESVRSAARAGRRPDDPSDCIGFRVVRELTSEERKFHELARDTTR